MDCTSLLGIFWKVQVREGILRLLQLDLRQIRLVSCIKLIGLRDLLGFRYLNENYRLRLFVLD